MSPEAHDYATRSIVDSLLTKSIRTSTIRRRFRQRRSYLVVLVVQVENIEVVAATTLISRQVTSMVRQMCTILKQAVLTILTGCIASSVYRLTNPWL